MNVSEAILSRHSIRAFLDTPVDRAVLEEILGIARYAPTGGNLQPWHVYAVAGKCRDRLVAAVAAKLPASPLGMEPEYHVYPPKLQEPYRSRRYKLGEDMYATIQVAREDRAARLRQFARNWEFFGAPVGLFFTLDRNMEPGQWADVGMFMQNVMLLARERGLDTCAQESWASWHELVRAELAIPDEQILFCGMALGYADPGNPINGLRADRQELAEFAHFHGFDAGT
jgi:nitroreductase